MKEVLLHKINARRRGVNAILISFLFIVTLALSIYMVNDTMSFHQKGFSNEVEYKEDIFFIVKLILCVIIGFSVLFGPYLYLMNRMYNRYLTLIGTLNPVDIIVMDEITQATDFLNRYSPKVIFKDDCVTLFSIFKDTLISLKNVTHISTKEVYFKGYKFIGHLKIKFSDIEFNYHLTRRNLVSSFLKHANLVNPNIIIERN